MCAWLSAGVRNIQNDFMRILILSFFVEGSFAQLGHVGLQKDFSRGDRRLYVTVAARYNSSYLK